MENGWIKIHRKLEKWEWYQDSKTFHLFIHLVLMANHQPKKWQGITVERGQLITGRKSLNAETGITEQSIRTSLERLKSTNEITIKSTSRFSIVTICNYNKYQDDKKEINQAINQQSNQQVTSNQPASNHKQECKNIIIKENTLSFDDFYKAYPKKEAKQKAAEAWSKIKPDDEIIKKMLLSIEKAKTTTQWQKDKGQYIPLPATWLNQKRWEDETQESVDWRST